VRFATRGVPRASSSPADAASPCGRLAGLGLCGHRGAGKTRAGACWIQQRVESGTMKLGCLIAPTAADIRDVMVDGPSGLINVGPPWSRPPFESSTRRVEWPNGARAVCLSGEEPERARSTSTPSGPTSWLAGSVPKQPGTSQCSRSETHAPKSQPARPSCARLTCRRKYTYPAMYGTFDKRPCGNAGF
jgi:hypothetical protein